MRVTRGPLILLALLATPAAAQDYLVWLHFGNDDCVVSDAGCFRTAADRERRRYSTHPEAPVLRIAAGGRGWVRKGAARDAFVVVRRPGVRLATGVPLGDDEEGFEVAIDSADNGRAVVDVKARMTNLAAASRITARLGVWERAVTLADGRTLLIRIERAP